MMRSTLLKHIIFLLLVIGIMDLCAEVFYLHWIFWWYDVILHFLAGGVVGMTTLLCLSCVFNIQSFSLLKLVIFAVVGAIIIGVMWEIFELYIGVTSLSDGIVYVRDTASDLIMDICGGFFGSLHANKLLRKN